MFEFVPNIRRPEAENFEHVAHVLDGGRDGVRHLDLVPGDLQLFAGRFSLHRVTQIEGIDHQVHRAADVRARPVPDESAVSFDVDLRAGDRPASTTRAGTRRRPGRLMTRTVAFIGLGNMGGPMARNVVAAGFELIVTDLDPATVDSLVADGASTAPDAAAAAVDVDVVITSLPGPAQVRAVGEQIIAAMRSGSIWIDLSTNDLDCARSTSPRCRRNTTSICSTRRSPVASKVPRPER